MANEGQKWELGEDDDLVERLFDKSVSLGEIADQHERPLEEILARKNYLAMKEMEQQGGLSDSIMQKYRITDADQKLIQRTITQAKGAKPGKVGQRWTGPEDALLIERLANPSLSMQNIADLHERKIGGIIAHKNVLALEEVAAGHPIDAELRAKYRLTEVEEGQIQQGGQGRVKARKGPSAAADAGSPPRVKVVRMGKASVAANVEELTRQLATKEQRIQHLEEENRKLVEALVNLSKK